MRRTLRFLPFILILSLTWLDLAFAQTISLDRQSVRIRRKNERPTNRFPDHISRQDCLDDDPTLEDFNHIDKTGERTWMQFAISMTNVTKISHALEIWASRGVDCSQQQERIATGNCRRVYRQGNVAAFGRIHTARVYPRVVVGRLNIGDLEAQGYPENVDAYPDESVCNDNIDDSFTFYLFLFDSDAIVDTKTWTGTRVDVAAPPPPEIFRASPGDGNAFLEWELPTVQEQADTEGFVWYCTPADATDVAFDPDAMGGAAGTSCTQGLLQAGEFPPPGQAHCGSVRGRTTRSGQAKLLENGQTYAIALSTQDIVGNVGRLSEVVCVQPKEVTTFFERYRDAGGQGGGGFCALGSAPRFSLLWTLALAGLTFSARRRRPRSC